MRKTILLALLGLSLINNVNAHITSQWTRILDSTTSNTNGITGFSTGSCDIDWTQLSTPRLTLSKDGSHIACVMNNSCNIFTNSFNAANGNILFQDINSGGNSTSFGVVYDKNNNLFTTGEIYMGSSANSIFLRKYNNEGTILFTNVVHNYNKDMSPMTRIDSNGRILLANISYTGSLNVHPLYCFSNTGSQLWTSVISNYDYYYGYPGVIDVDNNNNTIFTGKYQTITSDPSTYQVIIRKVDTSGSQLWQVNYSSYNECYARQVVIDKNNDIYMSITTNSFRNERLVKFNGSNGSVLWDVVGVGFKDIKVNDSNIIVMSTDGSIIKSYNKFSGSILWTKNILNGRSLNTDKFCNVYSITNSSYKKYNSGGSLVDSISVTISGFSITHYYCVINNNADCIYIMGQANNKVFISKYSISNHTTKLLSGSRGTNNLCQNSVTSEFNSWLKVRDSGIGSTMVFTRGTLAPSHGTLLIKDSVYTIYSIITKPNSVYYTPDYAYSGLDSFSINVIRGTNVLTRTFIINVNPQPTPPIITGDSEVCIGGVINLTSDITGGFWWHSDARASVDSLGNVIGLAGGYSNIRYASSYNSYGCRIVVSNRIHVIGLPRATITGASVVSVDNSITLISSSADGYWGMTNGLATIDGYGVITGIISGRDTAQYTITNICGTYVNNKIVNISAHRDNFISKDIAILSPNPNNGNFSIGSEENYTIIDIMGKLISIGYGKNISISVPTGIYFIKYAEKTMRFYVYN